MYRPPNARRAPTEPAVASRRSDESDLGCEQTLNHRTDAIGSGFRSAIAWEDVCTPTTQRSDFMLAIAGTGYGLIGLLVIVLLVLMIVYFVRRV